MVQMASCSMLLKLFMTLSKDRLQFQNDSLLNPQVLVILPQKNGILSNIVNALQYWKSRKYLQPNWWLQSWLRREIQALWQSPLDCILNWTKVVAGKHSHAPSSVKCPLCKTENLSIIYGYDGSSFQRQYINDSFELSSFFSKAHKYRLKCYYTEPVRYLEQYKIQALLQEEDVEIIVHHILGVVDSFLRRGDQSHQMRTPETKQGEFKNLVSDAARPFLAARTERFQLGWNTPRLTGEGADVEHSEHTPIVPYLYIFDDDSGETD
ncbi:hypothetical protein P3X46_035138 [Hevea brasiliensis]|uniref:CxC1-like cysteine cluster associated with KDZ transposases domain-containing protein n=1 Tax=Hevea brasiliensis TaxID=3981 RepID=A0ABQ9KDS5_HEVBR|nr:hypothetical protein P3X46_035138 [Hevea brasiliensis]